MIFHNVDPLLHGLIFFLKKKREIERCPSLILFNMILPRQIITLQGVNLGGLLSWYKLIINASRMMIHLFFQRTFEYLNAKYFIFQCHDYKFY